MLLFFTGLAGLTGNPAAPGRADAAPVSAVLIGTRIRTRSTHTWAGVCRCKRASSRLGFWPRCNLVSSVGRRMPRLLNLDDAFLSRRSRQNHIQEEPLRTTIHSPLLQLTFMELGQIWTTIIPGGTILVLNSRPGRRFPTTSHSQSFRPRCPVANTSIAIEPEQRLANIHAFRRNTCHDAITQVR